MQHLYGASVVVLLSGEVEKVLEMWHLELPEMKADVVVVALLDCPNRTGVWKPLSRPQPQYWIKFLDHRERA